MDRCSEIRNLQNKNSKLACVVLSLATSNFQQGTEKYLEVLPARARDIYSARLKDVLEKIKSDLSDFQEAMDSERTEI